MLWYPRQAYHDHLAVPEGSQHVGVTPGQGQRGDGELQRDRGQHLHGVEVPEGEVTILISSQQTVAGGEESWKRNCGIGSEKMGLLRDQEKVFSTIQHNFKSIFYFKTSYPIHRIIYFKLE